MIGEKSNKKNKIIYVIIHALPIYEKEKQYFLNNELPARDFMFHARFAEKIILAVPIFKGNKINFKVPLKHIDNKISVVRYSQKNIISFWISYKRIIQSGNIIHYSWKKSLLIAFIASFFRKKRVLVLDADIIDEMKIASQNPYYTFIKRNSIKLYCFLLKIYIACSGRLANVILSVGNGPADTLKKLGLTRKSRVIIASNIFPSDIVSQDIVYKKYQREKSLRIVVVSQLRYKKGIHIVLKALELLPKSILSKAKVTIIGSGPFEETLKKLAEPLKKIVEFKKPIPYGIEFFKLLDEYQIMIVPQLSNEQPRIIIDGMSRGILIIASDTLGNQTIIDHRENGLIYKKNDPIALKNILKEVLEIARRNPSIITKIAYKGLNFAKNHTVYHVHAKRDILLKRELYI